MTESINSLRGKVAVVTGGSRGIGKAIAQKLASEGATVAINYASNDVAANETLKKIEEAGGSAFLVKAALGEEGFALDIKTSLSSELARRGLPEQIDILVNNAGVGFFAGFEQSTIEQFDHLFSVNVRGVFQLTQALIPLINSGGRIINLSSGLSKRPVNQTSVYSMSKAAIDTFTIALAKEYGSRQITVNAVAPGWTHTDMNDVALQDEHLRGYVVGGTPLGRLGKPMDIANAVAWLSTDEAGWVTGQWLEASGGFGL